MECMVKLRGNPYSECMAEPHVQYVGFPHSDTWRVRQPSALVTHVLEVHHEPTRALLAKIDRLLGCVTDAFCVRPPLPEIAEEYANLRHALLEHLELEERDVFGAIGRLEGRPDGDAPPHPIHIERAIARARQEHSALQVAVVRLRAMSDELRTMDDTCRAMRALDGALADLERELSSHFQLESEVLFPRAEELERSVREESRR